MVAFSPVSPREHEFQNSASASSFLYMLLKFCAAHLNRMLRCPWDLAGTLKPDSAEGKRARSICTLWNDSSPQQVGFESQNSNSLAMNDPKCVVQEGLGKQLFLAVHSESFLKDYWHWTQVHASPSLASNGPLPIICPCCWWSRYRASKQGQQHLVFDAPLRVS